MVKRGRVIALGFFDGVHRGHAALMEMTKRRAEELGARPAVLTFDNHPDTLVRGVEVPLLNSPEDRAEVIRRVFGIRSVVFLHFSETVMQMPWQEFIDQLVDELSACHFVVGYDFRFGWRGEGTTLRLKAYCEERGLGCDIIPVVMHDGEVVSSTLIRKVLEEGDIERVNDLLGHPLSLVDTVRYGYRLGTKIGAPTINMQFQQGVAVPKHGVYATRVFLEGGDEYSAVTNVGVRPTVSGGERVTVETYLHDFTGDLYDRRVRVEFHGFIRPEQKFESVEALKEQIRRDSAAAKAFFEGKK